MIENSNLSMLIKDKAAEIEKNMMMTPSNPKIDMSLIEELK
jgi:hypothetical protein